MMRPFLLASSLLSLSLSIFSQSFEVDTLVYKGDVNSFINIVILGDGYQSSELSKFSDDATNITGALFNEMPYNIYQNYFNVFSIKIPSNESGAAMHPDSLIDNYFGSTYGYAGIDRLLVPVYKYKIWTVLANNLPAYDQVILLVNSSKYGGSGGSICTASTHTAIYELVLHELGHSFAGLADEYWAGSQYAREDINMTKETNLALLRWRNWYGDFGIGLYPHAESPSWYRPHQSCKMRYLGYDYCSVCTEATIERIHSLVSPLLNYLPKELSLTTSAFPLHFKVELIEPNPNTLRKIWELNNIQVAMNADSLVIEEDDLISGTNDLSLLIEDTTSLLRVDDHDLVHLTMLSWSIENTTTGFNEIESSVSEVEIQIFPNPTTDHVNIFYRSSKDLGIRVELFSMNGIKLAAFPPGTDNKFSVNLNEYPNGTYLVNFYAGNRLLTTRKITKQ